MGWKFWRCWGSHWRADPDACLEDLLATLARMGIEPIGGEFSPYVYTEHRVVDTTAPDVPADQDIHDGQIDSPVGETLVSPSLVTVSPPETPDLFTPPSVVPTEAPPIAVAESASEFVVEPGDTVIVRFDDNRIRRFRLSANTHGPEDGVVHINKPIGLALLGHGLEEEVEFVIDGKSRVVVIEKISKAAELELAG